MDHDQDVEWINYNTKKCPNCHSNIEKNDGCNQMTCVKCKHVFCWECLGDWKIHNKRTGGFYTCNLTSNTKNNNQVEDQNHNLLLEPNMNSSFSSDYSDVWRAQAQNRRSLIVDEIDEAYILSSRSYRSNLR